MLHNGRASRLYQALVKEKKVALEVDGGLNWPNGNPFEYDGPTLMTSFIVYPRNFQGSEVLSEYDRVIQDVANRGVSASELERTRSKMRSDWYAQLEIPIERASALAHAVLFDGNPARAQELPDELATVTSDQIQAFARKYLVKTNRTIIDRVPEKQRGAK
jgi:zinc protease